MHDARIPALVAPRLSAPDLPEALHPASPSRHGEIDGALVALPAGATDAAHAAIRECRVAPATVDRLDLTGATLVDVEVAELRATEVVARESRWRNSRISGGRIAMLDLGGAELSGVELRGIRIDYLSLGAARVEDLLIADCEIGALDVPHAVLRRVRFEGCRVDEVDTRGLEAEHLDLRGLEALSVTDLRALGGATLSPTQVERLAPALASALGIRVAP